MAAAFASYENVSRRHATITVSDTGQATIRDEYSTNGTFVNDDRVLPGTDVRITDGDRVRLGADVTAEVSLPGRSGFSTNGHQQPPADQPEPAGDSPGLPGHHCVSAGVWPGPACRENIPAVIVWDRPRRRLWRQRRGQTPARDCGGTRSACARSCSRASPTWHRARPSPRPSPPGSLFAGGSLPLAVVFALVACLFCAWSIGLLAREMPAAGSLATYAARGIHPSVGFLVAWAYVLVGWLIPPLVLLQLGFTVDGTLHSEFHGYTANLWWVVVDSRRADHPRGRLLRHQDLGPARHHSRRVRDRCLPGAGHLPGGARGQPQHRCRSSRPNTPRRDSTASAG